MITELLFTLATLTSPAIDTVYNSSAVQQIDGRDIRFGVKETVEELALENGIDFNQHHISVNILSIESPQQMINTMGLQWLRKDYIVKIEVVIDNQVYSGEGKRRTLLFAALLDVEGGEVPLNRKAFSKALESALEEGFKSVSIE
jgi:hypothetical protein